MNIELFGSAVAESTKQIDNAKNAKVDRSTTDKGLTNTAATSREDKTTLTSNSPAVQSLTKTAIETSPTRQAKVESLRQTVNSAQYQLDADKIAESLANADI